MRQGVGKGLGKGYKNLLEMDSYIHSLSRKGISQYSKYMNYPKDFPKNTNVKYHQGVFQNQWDKNHPSKTKSQKVLRQIKEVDKLKKEMFDLLYNVKTFRGEKAVKHEVLTIVVLRDKAHHFDFLKSYTDWNAVGSWTASQKPFRVQSYDDEKNKVIDVEFLDTKNDKVGKRIEVLLKKLNKIEVGEWLLYSRTTPISETSLSLKKERTMTMKAKGNVKVVEVSQFFDIKKEDWKSMQQKYERGVLPDTTGKFYLWGETPKFKMVGKKQYPSKGDVWYVKDKKGKLKLFKENYDTSD